MQFLTLTVLTFLAAALGPIQVSCACDDGYPVSWCLTYREEPGGPQPLAKDCKRTLDVSNPRGASFRTVQQTGRPMGARAALLRLEYST
ncbi:hypothetical protein PtA15_14A472 [Puccinia triticina]|uniref:Uncharacterized protein n=1 Tax=Puccinia triticina TaxID=208348 RepID=A0ABY7D4R4_9BASI|nr:uncharacterized protein PtA15_14A472 [Puccinia triticina]WAQ91588.1 hypothetical protein PtA15_14A472 [Puccinia triticina]WAR62395.1 hypothetical protein PtB15_14B490 [Puccinia triticina]